MRRSLLTAAALIALAGATACSGNQPGGDPTETPTTGAETTAPAESEAPTETEDPGEEPTGIDPRLEILVGTWEADTDETGPHGSELTINEDGTASLSTFVNQHGAYEGEITLGDADPHVFTGTEPETEDELTVELEFDAEADTLTLVYPDEGGTYVHTRV